MGPMLYNNESISVLIRTTLKTFENLLSFKKNRFEIFDFLFNFEKIKQARSLSKVCLSLT